MSTDQQELNQDDMPGPTKPGPEHAWLQRLVGEWTMTNEMQMPDGSSARSTGRESVKSLGGLFAFAETVSQMPDGDEMLSYFTLGYDVNFKEYRGCWFANVSSHIWQYKGTLSADGNTMTLDCEGPNMMEEGKTALYREVIEFQDDNHRTMRSYFQDEKGEFRQMMMLTYVKSC
jgi:hypothetical protein